MTDRIEQLERMLRHEEESFQPPNGIDLEYFKTKREELNQARIRLKNDFVGLDEIIDSVISNIENWYIMPDSLRRPHIVCLWGMTGVGKTDLVRKLVTYLNYNNSYCELDLTANVQEPNLSAFLTEQTNLAEGKPGILFVDEIQKFRMKDETGVSNKQKNHNQAFWELLSDGLISAKAYREQILRLLYDGVMHYEDYYDFEDSEPEQQTKKKSPFTIGYRSARSLKNNLKLTQSINEIMRWSPEEREEICIDLLKKGECFKSKDFSKLLIIISGNIDQAFGADNYIDFDVDADVLHKQTKMVNFMNIKDALSGIFYPEQVARFGNNHIIYPSLDKKAYEILIAKRLSEISVNLKDKHSINLTFDLSINEFIYRNGVVPSQGVRPTISTINGTVENFIPKIVICAIENDKQNISLHYSNEKIIAESNNIKLFEEQLVGEVDQIKASISKDQLARVAVHEAGHTIVYADLFKVAPAQIEINAISSMGAGFVGMHFIESTTSKMLKNKIAVIMAGMAAEENVFSDGYSAGVSADIKQATAIANKMVKGLGMDPNGRMFHRITPFNEENVSCSPVDTVNDLNFCHTMLKDGKSSAKTILTSHAELFKALVRHLIEHHTISQENFKILAAEYNLEINILTPEAKIYSNEADKLRMFLSKN